jgi:Beta-propeller repeat
MILIRTLFISGLLVLTVSSRTLRTTVPGGANVTNSRRIPTTTSHPTLNQSNHKASPSVSQPCGNLPIYFEPNLGQTDSQVKFIARGSGATTFLTATEAVFSLPIPNPQIPVDSPQSEIGNHRSAISMRFVGANPDAQIESLDRLPGISNYFIGNDPSQWQTNIPHHAKVRYRGIYPGIDLLYRGQSSQLEYDLLISPGADPGRVQIAFQGIEQLQIDAAGDLILTASGGSIRQHKPHIYQDAGGRKEVVTGSYVLLGQHQVGFSIPNYDAAKALVIDPVVSYSTSFGGMGGHAPRSIAVDTQGDVYLAGDTVSSDFPTTAGVLQPSNKGRDCGTFGRGPSCGDAFVSKLNAQGDTLLYSTYIGDTSPDGGWAIAVDSQGNAFVAGNARSVAFPTTTGAYQTTGKGGTCGSYSSSLVPYPCSDVFVLKLNPQGSSLLYSTLIGANEDDLVGGMAVDAAGNVYLSGTARGPDFPISAGAIQPMLKGGSDTFILKLNATGTALVYSSYLGGTGDERAGSISLDPLGNAFVAGTTFSNDFPTTASATQRVLAGSSDAFLYKINATGSSILSASYLGGSGADSASDIATDPAGNVYITGATRSPDFPVKPIAIQSGFDPALTFQGSDIFVTKFDPSGTLTLFSTFLGGSEDDVASKLAVDSRGEVTLIGSSNSNDFPVVKPIQPEKGSYDDQTDAVLVRLTADGTGLLYSTYLGGEYVDTGLAIAVDAAGSAYATGQTSSTRFPGHVLPSRQRAPFFFYDLFVTKVSPDDTSFVKPSLFVPIVLSSQGLNGSFYTTELTLTNRNTRDTTLSLTYIPAIGDGGGSASVVLPAGRQQVVPDAIAYLRALGIPLLESGNRGGTLRVEFSTTGILSYRNVAVTARTTTALPSGRAGLAYSAVPVWRGLTEPAYLFGLRQDEFDRSNVAIQNLGTPDQGEIQLRLTVFSGDPSVPLQQALPVVTLPPNGFHQINQILGSNGLNLISGYVRVERVSGEAPFYAYGVINDQSTSDGSFVVPIGENSRQGHSNAVLQLPAVVETGSYRSELVLVNWSALRKPFQLIYKAAPIQTPDRTATITLNLEPGEQRVLPNFVQFLREQGLESAIPRGTTYAGPLHIAVQAVDSGDKTQALVRTLGTEPAARFGVSYLGVTIDRISASNSWIYGLQQNAENRTNLAIASPFSISVNPDVFTIDLYDGDTGAKVRSIEGVTISDDGWKQLGSILSDYAPGTRQGYAHIRRVSGSGSRFYPYAVINDGATPGERTGDGAFIGSSP